MTARRPQNGEVAEWSNVPDSKSGVRVTVPWVRIPPSPPKQTRPPRGLFVLAERAGRLRALRGGIRRAGLASPARPNRPFAVRKADGFARRGRALQSGQTQISCSIAFTTQFRSEGPASARSLDHLTAARRAAPRAAGARCKARVYGTQPRPQAPIRPSPCRYGTPAGTNKPPNLHTNIQRICYQILHANNNFPVRTTV